MTSATTISHSPAVTHGNQDVPGSYGLVGSQAPVREYVKSGIILYFKMLMLKQSNSQNNSNQQKFRNKILPK